MMKRQYTMELEEMGIEVNGAAATIRGFKELLHGIMRIPESKS